MKFLMDYTGEVAVNTAFVKALNIETFSENEVFCSRVLIITNTKIIIRAILI